MQPDILVGGFEGRCMKRVAQHWYVGSKDGFLLLDPNLACLPFLSSSVDTLMKSLRI